MSTIVNEIKIALRMLSKTPGFIAIAIGPGAGGGAGTVNFFFFCVDVHFDSIIQSSTMCLKARNNNNSGWLFNASEIINVEALKR